MQYYGSSDYNVRVLHTRMDIVQLIWYMHLKKKKKSVQHSSLIYTQCKHSADIRWSVLMYSLEQHTKNDESSNFTWNGFSLKNTNQPTEKGGESHSLLLPNKEGIWGPYSDISGADALRPPVITIVFCNTSFHQVTYKHILVKGSSDQGRKGRGLLHRSLLRSPDVHFKM